MAEFALVNPEEFRSWHDESNTVVALAGDPGTPRLLPVMAVEFREPDLDNRLTAVAFLSERPPALIRKLPLA